MPLPQFIAEAMQALPSDTDELPIGDAKFLYESAGTGDLFTKGFSRMNG